MESPRARIDFWVVACWVATASLALALIYLGEHRLYQVDELQNAYMARVQALGKEHELFTSAPLFVIALSALAGAFNHTIDMMSCFRGIFVGVFWLNVLLLVKAGGHSLRSRTGALVLLGAATLAPMWDYGFEVRHDNLLLTGVLLAFYLGKPTGKSWKHAYFLIGAIAVTLQFTAFKAFLYWAPLSAALLVFPHPAFADQSRFRLLLRYCAGALFALLMWRGLYAWTHLWTDFTAALAGGTAAAKSVKAFPHWPMAERLLSQTPLLLALVAALAIRTLLGFKDQGLRYISWSTPLPETLLVATAIAIFMVNPTPYRYNLTPLVALCYLGVSRLFSEVSQLSDWRTNRALCSLGIGTALLCHVLPFARSESRLLDFPNDRQHVLVALAEEMTDPHQDRVYDASGLVLTRDSIGYRWFLHTLNMRSFYDGTYPTVRSMLATNPASVFLPNYRTNWLAPIDQVFIRQRYVPLSDDFWVLGKRLPRGGGNYECVHDGRYFLLHAGGTLSLDGQLLPSDVVELTRGVRRIESTDRQAVNVFWLGPKLQRLPTLPPGNHETTFNGDF